MTSSGPQFPSLPGFQAIKLGSGVLGKTAPLVAGLIPAAMFGMWMAGASNPYIVVGILVGLAVIISSYVAAAFIYGSRNPGVALLEGAELLKYQENELRTNDPAMRKDIDLYSQNVGAPPLLQKGDVRQ